jgi:hypothetical protein
MTTNSDKNNLISTIKYEERVQKRKERKRRAPNYLPINPTILGKMNAIIEDYFNKSHSASQDIIFQPTSQKEIQRESENAIIRNIMKKEMSKKFRDQDSLHSHLQKYLDFQKSKQSKSTQLPKIHSRQINTTKDSGKARKIQINRKPNGEIEKILYKCMLSQKKSNKEKSLIHKRIKYIHELANLKAKLVRM